VKDFLPDLSKIVDKIHFSGDEKPSLPVNWRIAGSSAALHGLEAAMVGLLLQRKYGVECPEMEINTPVRLLASFSMAAANYFSDLAQLFPMSLFMWTHSILKSPDGGLQPQRLARLALWLGCRIEFTLDESKLIMAFDNISSLSFIVDLVMIWSICFEVFSAYPGLLRRNVSQYKTINYAMFFFLASR
jgi:hypothetical protein